MAAVINVSLPDLELIHSSVRQLSESFAERVSIIKAELAKLRTGADRSGLSGEGRAEQILENIEAISRLILQLENKMVSLKNFIDTKIAKAIEIAKNTSGVQATADQMTKTNNNAGQLKK